MRIGQQLLFAVLLLISLTSCVEKLDEKYKKLPEGLYADIQTNKGDAIFSLAFDDTPVTVANFVSLADGTNTRVVDSLQGKPFYDGLTFHRVISKKNGNSHDFIIQGGDPLANSQGGPGYTFIDEFPKDSVGNLLFKHDAPGVLSMANGGPATNGSQFFILLAPAPHLDGKHTIFGKVVNGLDVVENTLQGDTINKIKIVKIGRRAKNFNAAKIFNKQFEKTDKVKSEFVENYTEKFEESETLPSGIKIHFLKKGTGKKPKPETPILVQYAVYFEDGSLLSTNYEEVAKTYDIYSSSNEKRGAYKPFVSKYSMQANLVQGFKEGLMNMKFGDKVLLYVPSHLAYGAQGRSGIPPHSNLIFELEMFPKVKK